MGDVPPGTCGFIEASAGVAQCQVLQRMGNCLIIALPRSASPEGALVQLVADGTDHEVSAIRVPKELVTSACSSRKHARFPFDAEVHKNTLFMSYLALRDEVPTTDSDKN